MPVLIAIALTLVGLVAPVFAQTGLQLRVLSGRPEMVSGGDALLRVDVPAGTPLQNVRVTLNGADVTRAFRADEAGRTLTGLVTGLTIGGNVVAAATSNSNGRSGAQLTLVNYPNAGPVFAGPHEQPFICETNEFRLRSGGTLGPPLDANCSIARRVDYLYRSTAGGDLKPLPDPKAPPADLATATTLHGRTVPYIVRIETGTVNRSIYQFAMLHDPARDAAPDFMTRPSGWNGRLIYVFGSGCTGGWYRQGATTGPIEDDVMLRQGYAVASASLTTFGNNCAELLSAETMMMVKERFIEAYGTPRFTIGWGGSGGSYQQIQIADDYPGLVDGIMPMRSFPDLVSATVPGISDARLLNHYFDTLAAQPYTDEQKRRIAGFGSVATLVSVAEDAGRIHVTEYCPAALPQALRYDPIGNPRGARCDVYDHAVNVYGRDPKTGFARRPLDNVGVQYGLGALNSGVITTQQFLDLNDKVGGFDQDGNMVAARSVGDPAAIRIAYRSGRLTNGGGGLATTPIIDIRAYRDEDPAGNIHLRYHTFTLRERLIKANGHADNQVMLTEDLKWGDSLRSPMMRQALGQMDRWLTGLSEDSSRDPQIVKVRRAKPADLVDACWTRGDVAEKIVETQVYGSGRCDALYPAHAFPRGVAGASVAADIIKCQLKQIDQADYHASFTAVEMARLKRIFAGGVCDWSKPGVDQQPPAGTWQTFNLSSAAGATR